MKRVGAIILMLMLLLCSVSYAEQYPAYVLCNPKSTVNIHFGPSKGASVIAYAECGDEITLDGKTKGEWVHIVDSWAENDAWIHRGYVSDSPVEVEQWEATGYLKVRIRNRIDGKIIGTLKRGEAVTVYACAIGHEGWAYTSRGYIMTEYLDDGMGGI